MRNLWKSEVGYLIAPFLFFSVIKFLFKALKLTKPFVTFKDVEEKWNDL